MRYLISFFLFLIFLSAVGASSYGETPEKPYAFDGFNLADSLDYSAESIQYFTEEHKVVLDGNAVVNYRGRTLKSSRITYYQDYDYLEAEGKQDSLGEYIETPVFKDVTGDEFKGLIIKYNMRTQQGFIKQGRTKYDKGYMAAKNIKRASDDTLFIADGSYTTCDLEKNPHFYFAGGKMKFIMDDKIIIKPIVGYLYDIPVLWFPYYVFPISKGRQSGFLTPRYGSSVRDGRYLSNVGYYFVPSDYIDYRVSGTLRERNGWLLNNWFNYSKKYELTGSVFGSYENRTDPAYASKQWKLRFSHTQTLSPTFQITGSGMFESSSYSKYNSYNLYDRLNRDMRSNLTLRKTWKESGNSLITSMTYTKDLDDNSVQSTLPEISFRKSRKYLFGGNDKTTNTRKYQITGEKEDTDKNWYENIYYTFNATSKNSLTDNSTKSYYNRQNGFSSEMGSSNTLLGWLVAEPTLSINESFITTNQSTYDKYKRTDNLTFGLSMNTTVYGMFNPKIGSLKALRHVMTPTISYDYGTRRSISGDDTDILFRFDRNDSDNSKVNSIDFNLRNVFQGKFGEGDKEKKADLFTLNFSSGVDIEEEDTPVSPLITTLDIKGTKGFSTRLTANQNFYHNDDTFHLFSPYLDNLSITTSWGMSQNRMGAYSTSARNNVNSMAERDEFDVNFPASASGDSLGGEKKSSGFPVRFNLSHTYGIRRSVSSNKSKYTTSNYIKPNVNFSPTQKMTVSYDFYYDIEKESVVSQRLVISRDLHCWDASVSWVPSGYLEGYYFLLNIKELPEVKVEKRRGTSQMGY